MKKFSDLNVKIESKNIFDVPQISIEDIINKEIEVLDFQGNITTRHGDGRYVLKILTDDHECKFFTNAEPIKKALDQVEKTDFPFQTIIVARRYGGGKKSFEFT